MSKTRGVHTYLASMRIIGALNSSRQYCTIKVTTLRKKVGACDESAYHHYRWVFSVVPKVQEIEMDITL